MFGFLIRKTLHTLWENFFTILFANLLYIFLGLGSAFLFMTEVNLLVKLLILVAVLIIVAVYSGGLAAMMRDAGNFEKPSFNKLFTYSAQYALPSALYVLAIFLLTALFLNAFLFYGATINAVTMVLSLVVLVSVLVLFSIAQYALPAITQVKESVTPMILINFFMDNPLYSLAVLGVTVILLAMSVFTLTIFPGFASIILLHSEAYRLRCKKYEYVKENPRASSKNVPWNRILYNEKMKISKRRL